jgi:RNA polymerase sigma factor (sigma-70 family)
VSKAIEGFPAPAGPDTDWAAVVERIRAGDAAAGVALYQNLSAGARHFLERRLRTRDVEDRLHNVFVIVVETIRRGALRDPRRLMGFVRTVLGRQANSEIARMVNTRRTSADLEMAAALDDAAPSPEQQAADHEQVELMKQVLRTMRRREFEVLTRFYLREQPPEQIRAEMRLTQTQFDLLKSRAKARLTRAMQQKLTRNSFNQQ